MNGQAKNLFGRIIMGVLALVAVALLGIILVGVMGCTIAPKPVTATAAAFDGNEQNGGFLGFLPSGGFGYPYHRGP